MQAYPVNRLVLHMTFALCLGIFLRGADQGLALRMMVFFLGFVLLLVCRRRTVLQRMLILSLTACLGFFLMHQHLAIQAPLANYADSGQDLAIVGKVTEARPNKPWLHLRIEQIGDQTLSRPVFVRVKKSYGDAEAVQPGSQLLYRGQLRWPERSRNPGAFDERDYLFSQGIHYSFQAKEGPKRLAAPQGGQSWLSHANEGIHRTFERHLNADQRALVAAVLFGETEGLHEDFYAFTQRIGIIHIFSVSGLHVGFIVAFILALSRFVGRSHSPYLILLMIPLLGLYVILAHANPPAIRAALMAVLALLAARLLRHKDMMVIVGAVAFLLLLPNPSLFWDIGFRLSFGITFGIVYGYPAVKELLSFLPGGLREALGLALTAELVSAPMVAWYFYVFAPLSILANLLIVPFFSVLVPLALIATLCAQLSPFLGALVFWPTRILIDTVLAIIKSLDGFFGSAHVYLGQAPLATILLYGFLLIFFFSGRLQALSPKKGQLGAFILLLFVLCQFHHPLDRQQFLTVLDVGQGSAAVACSSDGRWLVFDCGPGKDDTAQYLRYAACPRVDTVVLSHGDSDHIQGLRHILRDFAVDRVFIEAQTRESEHWQEVLPLLKKKRVQVHEIDGQAHYDVDGNTSLKLQRFYDIGGQGNESQLVARLHHPAAEILFPGDLVPQAFSASFLQEKVDILLAPHHGSRANWSQPFYEETDPELVIISCGRNNRFGHPHEEVVTGLQELALPLRRTDECGAIFFEQRAEGIVCRTFLYDES